MKSARLALLAILPASAALAQTAPPLGPRLQDATIIGRGSTILIKRLPVRTPSGIVYRDITIDLKIDPSGAVRADASGKPLPRVPVPATAIARDVTVAGITESETPPEVAAPFIAGTYRDDAGGGLVRVFSQGRHLYADFPTWSLAVVAGDTAIAGAEWYGGPLRTNPHRSMVARAGITTDAYSYGVMDSAGGGHFDQGMLIGAVQQGRKLTIVSFHKRGCCTYGDVPTGQVTYTLVRR